MYYLDRKRFQSTHSMRSATHRSLPSPHSVIDFNPRTPCGVRRDRLSALKGYTRVISIHALHAECDLLGICPSRVTEISIHALHAECDLIRLYACDFLKPFQSTHSMRSATGERKKKQIAQSQFQSTHSMRSATRFGGWFDRYKIISIHALHAECDIPFKRKQTKYNVYFNPRTPCGVRLKCRFVMQATFDFNPRTPCGVRQNMPSSVNASTTISIHALHAECDLATGCSKEEILKDFNPRTPCGVRR